MTENAGEGAAAEDPVERKESLVGMRANYANESVKRAQDSRYVSCNNNEFSCYNSESCCGSRSCCRSGYYCCSDGTGCCKYSYTCCGDYCCGALSLLRYFSRFPNSDILHSFTFHKFSSSLWGLFRYASIRIMQQKFS